MKRFFLLFVLILVLLFVAVMPAAAQATTPTDVPVTVDFWSSFIEKLTLAFLPPLAALIAGFLIFQIKLVMAKIKTENPDVYDQMIWVVGTAVKAAEQAGAAGLIKDKKTYALDYVQSWLSEKGLKIDLSLIDKAIEAAVYEEINKPQTPLIISQPAQIEAPKAA